MGKQDNDRIEFYTDSKSKFRWRIRSKGNSKILADSGQGYSEFSDVLEAARRVTNRIAVHDWLFVGQPYYIPAYLIGEKANKYSDSLLGALG